MENRSKLINPRAAAWAVPAPAANGSSKISPDFRAFFGGLLGRISEDKMTYIVEGANEFIQRLAPKKWPVVFMPAVNEQSVDI